MATTRTKSVTRTVEQDPRDHRNQLIEIKGDIDNKWVEFSLVAAEVYETEEYKNWGFLKAEEFAKSDLGMEYRTFMNRVHIGRVITQLGISSDTITKIGASKFKEIALLMGEDTTQAQINKLIDKAEKSSFRELQDYVKKARIEHQGGESIKRTTLVFKFRDDQAEIVNTALEEAISKFVLDVNDPMSKNIALENICEWFLLETEGRELPATLLKKVEEAKAKAEAEEKVETKVKHKKHAHAGKKKEEKKKVVAKKAIKKVAKKKKAA